MGSTFLLACNAVTCSTSTTTMVAGGVAAEAATAVVFHHIHLVSSTSTRVLMAVLLSDSTSRQTDPLGSFAPLAPLQRHQRTCEYVNVFTSLLMDGS
eukprot:m.65927 g.65927  ORF g.65927 m.65927 type:complete len:97 (+) comp11539_c7_seq1:1351-1641(+)